MGEFVPTGGAVFAVHGGRPPDDRQLLACLDLGRSRTLYQDPIFGIRQLVDVGTQALSPALNQTSTAVQVIDRLHDLLLRIGRQPVPSGMHADDGGVVRLVEDVCCCKSEPSKQAGNKKRDPTRPHWYSCAPDFYLGAQ